MAETASWKVYRGTIHVLISAHDEDAARRALEGIGPEAGTRWLEANVIEMRREGPTLAEGGDA